MMKKNQVEKKSKLTGYISRGRRKDGDFLRSKPKAFGKVGRQRELERKLDEQVEKAESFGADTQARKDGLARAERTRQKLFNLLGNQDCSKFGRENLPQFKHLTPWK